MITIIIPCYNEVRTIEIIVNKILKLNKYEFEIIIVDDYSIDGTREILKDKLSNKVSLIIYNEKNYGKGYCIKKGIEHRGFSHIDILQPCVSFNKENTYEWYKNVIYKLEEHKYTPDNKEEALIKAKEFETSGKMPTGIFYEKIRES